MFPGGHIILRLSFGNGGFRFFLRFQLHSRNDEVFFHDGITCENNAESREGIENKRNGDKWYNGDYEEADSRRDKAHKGRPKVAPKAKHDKKPGILQYCKAAQVHRNGYHVEIMPHEIINDERKDAECLENKRHDARENRGGGARKEQIGHEQVQDPEEYALTKIRKSA